MFSDAARNIGNRALDFLMELGEIALVAGAYFAIAYIVVRVLISRLKDSSFLARYGKNGSMIAFRLISIAVYLVAIVGVLSYMGVNSTGLFALASAFTVAIGLSLQDVMRNLISGLFMLAERPFSVGDRVMIRTHVGTVQGIDIRTTMLRTDDGALLMVPNQLMFTEVLQNKTRFNMRIVRYRITSPLPVEELKSTLEAIIAELESVRPPLAPPVLVQHSEMNSEWEVSFSVSAIQMTHENEIGEAIVAAMPEATIVRVEE